VVSKRKNFKLVLLFTLLAMIASLAVIPYELALMRDNLGITHISIITIVVQSGVVAFITSYIGLTLANKIGLDAHILRAWIYDLEKPSISKKGFIQAITIGFFGSAIILTIEYFVFRPFIPQITMNTQHMVWWKGLLASFYGGVFEEILCRLFIMSLLVWVLAKLISKGQAKPRNFIYWIGIIVSALAFGTLHLPLTITMFGALTPLLVIRTVFLNGLLGVAFGYLYWKRGLEYAMLSHIIGDIMLHVILGN
jgi:membrane protease YdiL (CAAX protease family)